jgi:hypothetical protein
VGRPATPAQLQQVHRYALASFLLGTNGTQYFYFSPNGNDDGVNAPDTPDDHVNPGLPLAGYAAQPNGAYVRPFSAGYAAVNPTTVAVTVNLGGTYVDLDGQSVQQATLPPHSGMVFTKAATPTSTPPTSTPPTTTPSTTTTVPATTTTTVAAACPPVGRPTATTRLPRTTSTTVLRAAARARRCRPRRAP